MKKIRLLYIFSKPRDFRNFKKYSSSIFYGYDQFIKDSCFKVSLLEKPKKNLLWLLWRPFEFYFSSKTGVGFRLDQILLNLKLINSQDIVLAVNDSAGVVLALFKKLKLIKPKIVFISAGLINNLEVNQKHWLFKFYRWFLKSVDLILCWSPLEKDLYKSLIKAKAKFIPLEADLSFYKPRKKEPLQDFILCVGRDVGRDFGTLFKALSELKIPAKVIASPTVIKNLEIPTNVEVYTGRVNYPTLFNWYKKARLTIVNLKEINRFTGQRALLEALAMQKVVIAAKTRALTSTYKLRDGKEIIFYKPGDVNGLRNKIQLIYGDLSRIKAFGKNAREYVEKLPKNWFFLTLRRYLLKL